ncbi:Hypothetical_protein [Hexamita inflata]|uniref:Hypothetical_protein n=1 Tax=Hexamita inflata TaxID=28002 RepID=A0AA86P0D5_9EUKA|nr:Hypothetical protein HINF_LOCUS16280 [Hexamita inflata]
MTCCLSFYILSNILRRKLPIVFLQILTCEDHFVLRSIIISGWSCLIQSETGSYYITALSQLSFKMKLSARLGAGGYETSRCAVQLFHQAKAGNVFLVPVTLHTTARLLIEIQAASFVVNSSFGVRAVLSVLRRRSALSLLRTTLNVISSFTERIIQPGIK